MEEQSFFNQISEQYANGRPFVVFRKPNEQHITAYLPKTNALVTNNTYSKDGFVFSPFDDVALPQVWFYDEGSKIISLRSYKAPAEVFKQNETKEIDVNEGQLTHERMVNKALELLRSGELQKVVLSKINVVKAKQANFLKSFKKALAAYPNAFCYCWYHPKVGLWIGASPETLIEVKNNQFTTMALAGTQPYDAQESKVVWGYKEREEQQFVVDSILSSINNVVDTIKVAPTITHKAGSLLHLKTNISGKIKKFSMLKVLVQSLHPTPAVCGLPKVKSKKFILENEIHNRAYYTGYLGQFSTTGTTHLFVNLRCMQWTGEQVHIYVGGGITALSNPKAEWDELVNKCQIMKRIL